MHINGLVSIPDRDYRGFRLYIGNLSTLCVQVSIPDRDYRGFRLPTSETLAVFSFQGSIATTSSNYSISALAFDNPLE